MDRLVSMHHNFSGLSKEQWLLHRLSSLQDAMDNAWKLIETLYVSERDLVIHKEGAIDESLSELALSCIVVLEDLFGSSQHRPRGIPPK